MISDVKGGADVGMGYFLRLYLHTNCKNLNKTNTMEYQELLTKLSTGGKPTVFEVLTDY